MTWLAKSAGILPWGSMPTWPAMVTSLVVGERGTVEMWVYDGAGGRTLGGLWSCLVGCVLGSDMFERGLLQGDLFYF